MTTRVITLIAMVSCLSVTAQAADTTLTLACQGTTTISGEDAKPEPISMGIIVNFTKRTVHGFGDPDPRFSFMDVPVKITGVNEVTVAFAGSQTMFGGSQEASINGSIDRVTGDVFATSMSTDKRTSKIIISTNYTLKCRPAQRMF
jgi:hypothetical protein